MLSPPDRHRRRVRGRGSPVAAASAALPVAEIAAGGEEYRLREPAVIYQGYPGCARQQAEAGPAAARSPERGPLPLPAAPSAAARTAGHAVRVLHYRCGYCRRMSAGCATGRGRPRPQFVVKELPCSGGSVVGARRTPARLDPALYPASTSLCRARSSRLSVLSLSAPPRYDPTALRPDGRPVVRRTSRDRLWPTSSPQRHATLRHRDTLIPCRRRAELAPGGRERARELAASHRCWRACPSPSAGAPGHPRSRGSLVERADHQSAARGAGSRPRHPAHLSTPPRRRRTSASARS